MVNHLAVGPAPETGSELFRFVCVIAFHPDDPVVLNMQSQGTTPATIKGGRGPYDFYFLIGRIHILIIHIILSPIFFTMTGLS
jgi:hypothetical protein